MEALSTLTIGNNVLRVRAQGAQERLVAAIATAQAGCTPATGEGASPCLGELNITGQVPSQYLKFPISAAVPLRHLSDKAVFGQSEISKNSCQR